MAVSSEFPRIKITGRRGYDNPGHVFPFRLHGGNGRTIDAKKPAAAPDLFQLRD
jgi:hypothetical protein